MQVYALRPGYWSASPDLYACETHGDITWRKMTESNDAVLVI